MTKEERREWAEFGAIEDAAMVYNFTFNKEKTWEESYKEALIVAEDRHQNLWENCLILQNENKIISWVVVIQGAIIIFLALW